MNDQAYQLLGELATKLGTTVELLWTALVRQAPIAATGQLVLLAVLVASFCYVLRWTIATSESDGSYEIPPRLVPSTVLGTLGILLLVSLSRLPLTFAGFFNPEYWALREVLRLVSK